MTICQVPGCSERAEPWAEIIDLDAIEIEVFLCRRHALDRRAGGDVPGRAGRRSSPASPEGTAA